MNVFKKLMLLSCLFCTALVGVPQECSKVAKRSATSKKSPYGERKKVDLTSYKTLSNSPLEKLTDLNERQSRNDKKFRELYALCKLHAKKEPCAEEQREKAADLFSATQDLNTYTKGDYTYIERSISSEGYVTTQIVRKTA